MSAKDLSYNLRLSEKERKQLEDAANAAGFQDIAKYLRHVALDTEQNDKLEAIHQDVKQILKKMDKK